MDQHQLNMRDRSDDVFIKKTSTPFTRLKNVRQSLCKIQKNTVSGMVNLFTHQSKLGKADSPSKLSLFEEDKSVVTDQISYFNELSSVNQASECEVDSKLNQTDSGDDFTSVRKRSKSYSTSNVKKNPLERYAEFPNFKWRYLKYFGVDPVQYLSGLNVDRSTISEMLTDHTTMTGNGDGVHKSDSMRKRSQSLHVKKLDGVTETQESNLESVGATVGMLISTLFMTILTETCVTCHECKKCTGAEIHNIKDVCFFGIPRLLTSSLPTFVQINKILY